MTTTEQADSGASTTIPAVGEEHLVIVGATGMVGGYALRFALDNSAVKSVTSIGRITHPKLKEVVHQNFADCSALADALSGQDAVVYCLGTYTGSVSDADLRIITADYTIEFARVLKGSSPNAAFSFLSGRGADQSGQSRLAFARYKGEAEKTLLADGFPRVYLFRPAYIKVPYFLVAELAPLMAKRGKGAIVNLSTMAADYGAPGMSLYGSSKAAINLLTKTWAAEYGPSGVRVNAVSPGPTRTEVQGLWVRVSSSLPLRDRQDDQLQPTR